MLLTVDVFCIYKIEGAGVWETECGSVTEIFVGARASNRTTDVKDGKDRRGYERDKIANKIFMLSYSK